MYLLFELLAMVALTTAGHNPMTYMVPGGGRMVEPGTYHWYEPSQAKLWNWFSAAIETDESTVRG